MTDERDRVTHLIELLTDELHQSQRRQQALISALEKARAELYAINSGVAVYFDGEKLVCS